AARPETVAGFEEEGGKAGRNNHLLVFPPSCDSSRGDSRHRDAREDSIGPRADQASPVMQRSSARVESERARRPLREAAGGASSPIAAAASIAAVPSAATHAPNPSDHENQSITCAAAQCDAIQRTASGESAPDRRAPTQAAQAIGGK